jgi:hypothetical protein
MLSEFVLQHPKQAQINTVVVQQKEMDRVGVEPTTSAAFNLAPSISYLKGRDDNHT